MIYAFITCSHVQFYAHSVILKCRICSGLSASPRHYKIINCKMLRYRTRDRETEYRTEKMKGFHVVGDIRGLDYA